jgi:xanthine dehydrogenase large subunit
MQYDGNTEHTIHKSKAVGEPPLMSAFSVFHAIRYAVRASIGPKKSLKLDAPATPESVLRALNG